MGSEGATVHSNFLNKVFCKNEQEKTSFWTTFKFTTMTIVLVSVRGDSSHDPHLFLRITRNIREKKSGTSEDSAQSSAADGVSRSLGDKHRTPNGQIFLCSRAEDLASGPLNPPFAEPI